jgi:hypothetical protein
MGFETVVVADVKLEKNIPSPGEYVFQLMPGANERPNKFNGVNELHLSAAVAEGDQAGKRIFWQYPDPTATDKSGKPMAWSSQAMKKLQLCLGIDELPGETFPEYFRRVSANGAARFGATVDKNIYVKDGKEVEGDPKFNIFSVKAAA